MSSNRIATATTLIIGAILALGAGPSSALAESHPQVGEFGSFSDPNGIAIAEATGDVYVADIGTNTVYQFDAEGKPVNFSGLGSNGLSGIATPAKSFAFPGSSDTPAAVAVDNSLDPADPSRGDLYVMDTGHGVIDKFNARGEYIAQIASGEALGLGIDGHGEVRVATSPARPLIEVFDNREANSFVETIKSSFHYLGAPGAQEHGFAVSPAGDDYNLFFCGCIEKFGGNAEPLGRVDSGTPSDVALAVDSATGHVYVDDQSSVQEWDTGRMNGDTQALNSFGETEITSSAALVSSFGSSQLVGAPTGQGGIAVDGASGEVYVSSPADGKVHVFGTSVPAASAGTATGVSREDATLQGTVNPHGAPVTACMFEYEASPESGSEGVGILHTPVTKFEHEVSCTQSVGSGTSPVSVSAPISGLAPGRLYQFRVVAENASGLSESGGLLATAAPAFAIKSFEVSFLNEDNTADTQAGSHPYHMVTNIAFDTKVIRTEPEADSQYVTVPAGSVRDIAVDLPPGFVGDPNATATKCTLRELEPTEALGEQHCPGAAQLGELEAEFGGFDPIQSTLKKPVFNMVPPKGVALQIGGNFIVPDTFIDAGVRAGGDYPVRAVNFAIPAVEPIVATRLTVLGVVGSGADRKPFLTLPTGCTGPLRSTVYADSYQEPRENVDEYVHKEDVTSNGADEPVNLTGCSKLQFPPQITVKPDTTNASSASGLTVDVNVPQKAALNPDGLAESALRDTTVTLPEGVAINPSGGDGLQACSEGLAGFQGFTEFNKEFEPGIGTATFTPEMPRPLLPGENFCPDGSKIGTVKLKTPLLEHELEGAVYLASQNANPFGSLIAMYMFVEDPQSGSLVKLTGEVSLNPTTGQVVTTFQNTPDLPFENLELHFFGGERAPLTTPAHCGTYTTTASFTPWDGNGPVNTSSSFQIEHGPNGGPCPGASLPFTPSLAGGTSNINAGAFSPLTTTISRPDGDQNLQSVKLHMPAGLEGLLSNVKLCPEAQANVGTCGPESLIGETTVSAGVGSDPVSVKGGKVYLTEKYAGAPFGLAIVNPVKAGPFDLEHDSANPANQPACDCLVVRAKIEVDPRTAELTITTDPSGPHAIPNLIDGVPVQIKAVNVTINREHFTFNPTSCDPMSITGTIGADEGASFPLSDPFQVTNCASLSFTPTLAVTTGAHPSKVNGAGLAFKIAYPKGAMGTQSWFSEAKFDLPKQLPARLTTIQKACLAATFESNRSACPAASKIGHAVVHTPVLPVPLEGPVYFVSYGGAKFPDAVLVLDGYGVHIELHGETFIDGKTGQTSATFRNTPDVPFESIEVSIPTGPFSEFGANLPASAHGSFCGQKLVMPTLFKAQNGMEIHRNTPITVTGCPKGKTRAQKLAAALKACHKKHGRKRATCERAARKAYGARSSRAAKGKRH